MFLPLDAQAYNCNIFWCSLERRISWMRTKPHSFRHYLSLGDSFICHITSGVIVKVRLLESNNVFTTLIKFLNQKEYFQLKKRCGSILRNTFEMIKIYSLLWSFKFACKLWQDSINYKILEKYHLVEYIHLIELSCFVYVMFCCCM